mmetsp:Transcript_18956/g.30983  ORF Transcript_18956/g.30983 Transcript_18956/m.30983 type:complete len:374 (+) Transcript_18956:22-1143(+)
MNLKRQVWRALIRHKSVSFITVENARVGIVLRLLQLSIFVLACFQVFHGKQYFQLEKPDGFANSWVEGWAVPTESPTYCNNPAFDFEYSSAWVYKNNSCRDFQLGEAWSKLPSGGVYVQTYVQESLVSSSGCDTSGTKCASSNSSSKNVFVPGIENIRFGMDHSMHTSFRTDLDVKTELMSPDKKTVLKTFEAGSPIMVSLVDVMNAAGMGGLDSKNEDAYVSTSSGMAAYRMTGFLLLFEFEYSNVHTMTGEEVIAKLYVRDARVGWAGSGPQADSLEWEEDEEGGTWSTRARDLYSYGIKLQILYSGSVGEPSPSAAINALVTYSVLFAFAGIAADFVAEYFTPEISEVFRGKKREPLSATVTPEPKKASA